MLGKRPFETVVLILVFAVCAAVRLWGLNDQCLWFDEIFSIHAAEHGWTALFQFAAKDLIHPPLFYVVLKLWICVGGESLAWLRLLPAFLSILAFFPGLMLCRELKLSRTATLISLAIFSVNGALIKYAQEVRMYSLLLLLSSTSTWLFARYFFRGKSFWPLVVTNVLLVNTHYFGWLVVLVELGIIVFAQRIKVVRMLRMLAITVASFVPWIAALSLNAEPGSSVGQNIGWMKRPAIAEVLGIAWDLVDPFYSQQSSDQPVANYIIAVPIVIIIAIASVLFFARFAKRDDKPQIYFLAAFAASPLVIVFVLSWLMPVSFWGSRHLLIVFVPAFLLIGMCVKDIVPKYLMFGALACLAALGVGAFVMQASAPRTEHVWCAWNGLAAEWRTATIADPDPKRLYVFEDLIAYHYWFATRDSLDWKIVLVKDAEGVPNDRAYFLPRGFNEVESSALDAINEPEIWISFRQAAARRLEAPVTLLENRGYAVTDTKREVFGTQAAYLIRLVRTNRMN